MNRVWGCVQQWERCEDQSALQLWGIHLSVRLIENKALSFAAEQKEWTVESWKKLMVMWYLAWSGVTATPGEKKESDWSDKHLLSGGSWATRGGKAVILNPSPVFTIFKTVRHTWIALWRHSERSEACAGQTHIKAFLLAIMWRLGRLAKVGGHEDFPDSH